MSVGKCNVAGFVVAVASTDTFPTAGNFMNSIASLVSGCIDRQRPVSFHHGTHIAESELAHKPVALWVVSG